MKSTSCSYSAISPPGPRQGESTPVMAQAEGLSSMVTIHPIDAEIRRTAPPVA